MTDLDTIVADVTDDPTRLDEYNNDLQYVLDLNEPAGRQTVAELLRVSANRAPAIVGQQTTLLRRVLTDDDETVCEDGIHAVAVITETHSEAVASLVSELLEALSTVDDPAAQGSAVRALATISHEAEVSVSEGDEVFATLLRDGDGFVRDIVAGNISIDVMKNPSAFSQTLRAYVDALTDTDPDIQMFAVETLAVVADDEIDAIPDIAAVQSRLKDIQSNRYLDSDKIERAITVIQQAADGVSR
jgi:hypothetical protein